MGSKVRVSAFLKDTLTNCRVPDPAAVARILSVEVIIPPFSSFDRLVIRLVIRLDVLQLSASESRQRFRRFQSNYKTTLHL